MLACFLRSIGNYNNKKSLLISVTSLFNIIVTFSVALLSSHRQFNCMNEHVGDSFILTTRAVASFKLRAEPEVTDQLSNFCHPPQQTNTYPKSTIEPLEKCLGSVV